MVLGSSPCDLFGNLESVYVFLTDGKRRVAVYEAHVKKLYPGMRGRRLKRVSTTRWLSHSYALDAVLDTFEAVVLSLQDIANTSEAQPAATASGLEAYLRSERFLLPAFAFKRIFSVLAVFTKMLQAPDYDLLQALAVLESSLEKIKNMRNEATLFNIIAEAREFGSKVEQNCEDRIHIAPLLEKRVRRVTRQQDSQSRDDPEP